MVGTIGVSSAAAICSKTAEARDAIRGAGAASKLRKEGGGREEREEEEEGGFIREWFDDDDDDELDGGAAEPEDQRCDCDGATGVGCGGAPLEEDEYEEEDDPDDAAAAANAACDGCCPGLLHAL